MTTVRSPVENFIPSLIAGDAAAIRALFPSVPAVDTPFSGAVAGETALEAMVATEGSWLRLLGARAETRSVMHGDGRVVAEVSVTMRKCGVATGLPVAVVGQTVPGGFDHIRTYHSFWPITGSHRARAPFVWPDGRLDEPPIIERYFAALARGDEAAIQATFAPEGSIREPSGEAFRHSGPEGRSEFYGRAFARPGGVPLLHASATRDGDRFAVEYIADRWGDARFPPTPGCAVYEMGAASGLIRAVRIYDDLSPPSEGIGS